MSNSTLTPNMSLVVPTIGTEAGPTYAQDINSSLSIVDGHNHTPGSGVQITPAAMNINAALTFVNNPITNLQAVNFTTQSVYNLPSSLYTKLGTEATPIADLFFRDGSGTEVQITSNSQVNATAASIPGESYGGGTFSWRQGTGSTVPANFDIGSVVIRPNTAATTYGVTLAPQSGIASAYTLVLPALPASPLTNVMTLDYTGNMSTVTYDAVGTNMTSVGANAIAASMTAAGGVLSIASRIPTGTIVGTQLNASAGILGTQLSNTAGITASQISSVSTLSFADYGNNGTTCQAGWNTTSSSFQTVTGFVNVSFPTLSANRPLLLYFNFGNLYVQSGSASTQTLLGAVEIIASNGLTTSTVSTITFGTTTTAVSQVFYVPSSSLNCINVTGKTSTFTVYARIASGTGTIFVDAVSVNAVQL